MNNPRIESLHVKNYRALQDLTLKDLTPLTVFLGANGSGKSTILDIFAFLSECFAEGLRRAWDRRNRFRELRSRGSNEPITFEIKYRETPDMPLITYHLSIDEDVKGPFVRQEWLSWRRKEHGKPFRFLDFQSGEGRVISGDDPDESGERIEERLSSPDVLAVSTLGQLAKHPRVNALRQFIMGWYLSYLTADNTRVLPQSGPDEHLSPTGDNLPNVIQYLHEQHPDLLETILTRLSARVPRLERVEVESTIDGRLVLQIKDAPFDKPILSKFASDSTLKMLAYLTVLYDPNPPQWMGIEEPENHLHPRLLMGLAEECRRASSRSQLMVTTHAPYFVDGLKPKELWVLYRDKHGYTQAKRASDMPAINDLMNHGALLGNLWMEGQFECGDPLTNQGDVK
ncbi:MAG: AAA family ATPase [Phototrophicaceae bacterium]